MLSVVDRDLSSRAGDVEREEHLAASGDAAYNNYRHTAGGDRLLAKRDRDIFGAQMVERANSCVQNLNAVKNFLNLAGHSGVIL
jgi:hypothetical protein